MKVHRTRSTLEGAEMEEVPNIFGLALRQAVSDQLHAAFGVPVQIVGNVRTDGAWCHCGNPKETHRAHVV